MTKISIMPQRVWSVAVSTAKDYPCLGSVALGNIADDDEKGIQICMRSGDDSSVFIYVMQNGTIIYERETDSADECEKIVKEVLTKYLSYSDEEDSEEDCDDTPEFCEDEIFEREEWLDQAVMDFLETVIGDDFQMYEPDALGDLVEDCKDHFLEYLARKHSVPVFRPMLLEDEDGNDYYSEYPYEEMEFEDEDNPIYM